MQSRNSLIGDYSEQWVKSLLTPLAKQLGVCAIRGAVCNEIGLSKASPADIAICKSHTIGFGHEDFDPQSPPPLAGIKAGKMLGH